MCSTPARTCSPFTPAHRRGRRDITLYLRETVTEELERLDAIECTQGENKVHGVTIDDGHGYDARLPGTFLMGDGRHGASLCLLDDGPPAVYEEDNLRLHYWEEDARGDMRRACDDESMFLG